MPQTSGLRLESLGLGGDGDEIDAISDVERTFGVQLDHADARSWRTVGDIFTALQRALPPERADADALWPPFTHAISAETGVDPGAVTRDTLLLAEVNFDWRLLCAAAGILALAFAVFHIL